MITIRDVIRNREPYSVRASETVQKTAEFMAERNIGAVCVLDEAGHLAGIFSERDLLNRVVARNLDPAIVKVSEVMSESGSLTTIKVSETPRQALESMETAGIRHLPVVDGEQWVGLLSIRDLLRVEVNEKIYELRFLHDYISQ